MTTLLIVGATGLVGQSVLQQALADRRVTKIVAPTRHPLPAHDKLHNPQIDFDHLPSDAPWWAVDGVICTLGTTMRRAGSEAAFRKVDLDYPTTVAKLAQQHGARSFALNSATGANPHSKIFYNRTKGEVEQALKDCGFPSLTLVRPALLGGNRAEFRPAEFFSLKLLGTLNPMLPRRYRVVPAERVAHTLLEAAIAATPGVHIIESEAIR